MWLCVCVYLGGTWSRVWHYLRSIGWLGVIGPYIKFDTKSKYQVAYMPSQNSHPFGFLGWVCRACLFRMPPPHCPAMIWGITLGRVAWGWLGMIGSYITSDLIPMASLKWHTCHINIVTLLDFWGGILSGLVGHGSFVCHLFIGVMPLKWESFRVTQHLDTYTLCVAPPPKNGMNTLCVP